MEAQEEEKDNVGEEGGGEVEAAEEGALRSMMGEGGGWGGVKRFVDACFWKGLLRESTM
jgi:hypothetical protein